ncbi:hypothetical protein KKG71_01340 [Patescibacteria group bacterium]|nr:hypothetical protein [Patescibacteria group bacterium]
MIKKIVILLVLSSQLMLTGCLGIGEPSVDVAQIPPNYKIYTSDEFNFIHYLDWEITEKKNLPEGFAPETQIAIRNNLKDKLPIANVVILKTELPAPVDVVEYGKQVLNKSKKDLVNFSLENQEQIENSVAGVVVPAYYLVFTGKVDAKRDTIRYHQKIIVNSNIAYIVTFAAAVDEDEIVLDKGKTLLKSFLVK